MSLLSLEQLDSLISNITSMEKSKAGVNLEPHSDPVIPGSPWVKFIFIEFLQLALPSCQQAREGM